MTKSKQDQRPQWGCTIVLFAIVAIAMPFGRAFAQSPNVREAQSTSSDHPGKAIYDKACASCHNNPEASRAPGLDSLKRMFYMEINYALTKGKMKDQGARLSVDERVVLIQFLLDRKPESDKWMADMKCPADRKINLSAPATVSTFGFNRQNHRYLTSAQAGLKTADFENLELAWAMGFPGVAEMRSQPAVVGSTLFLPIAETANVFAIDISGKPCLQWVYQSDVILRTSAAYGELPQSKSQSNSKAKRKVIVVGDLGTNILMLDAQTGQLIWKQYVGQSDLSMATGTPIIYKDRVYAPVSQYEITVGDNPNRECCKTHGAVVALDAATGKIIWTMHTMEDAKPLRDRGDGKMYWGPSGAPIWNSPAIDEQRGLLYVGTGEATSEPAHKNTDAILAVDLKDGSIRWSFQATPDDIFLSGCALTKTSLNCPRAHTVNRDVDFGASTILARRSDGKDLVLAGQKGGTLWALDPDTGKLIWKQEFGEGSPLGGIHWGIAFDGKRVFAPINHAYPTLVPPTNSTQMPGMHSVNVDTGEVLWTFVAKSDCSGDRAKRVKNCAYNIGLSGAPSVIDGAVVSGSVDGFLRAFDANTGEVIFKYDTAREFETINGVKANGGAIDVASIVAANGYLFVASGYGMFGQLPGNVLLAFKPKAKP